MKSSTLKKIFLAMVLVACTVGCSRNNGEEQYLLGMRFLKEKKYNEAAKCFLKAAECGHAGAQYELGWCHSRGEGAEPDSGKAAYWWRKAASGWREAAERGDANAQYELARCYAQGIGVERDQRKTIHWYRQAAEQGHAYAQYNLGWYYGHGEGVDKDCAQAAAWYRKAAEQGYAEAQFRLAMCYHDGEGVEKNLRQAVIWYRKAAEQKDELAYLLGGIYEEGRGIEKDYNAALHWYRKAAEQGHKKASEKLDTFEPLVKCINAAQQGDAKAQYELGKRYENRYKEKAAVYWYRKAAEQGYTKAQVELGACYAHGRGVSQDPKSATVWYRKAAELGDANAQCTLGLCYDRGFGVDKDHTQAVVWYRKAAESGHADAQFNLGVSYYEGEGVEKNLRQAVIWYRKAAEQGDESAQTMLKKMKSAIEYLDAAERGDSKAQFALGECYAKGNGVPKDPSQTVYWYRKAAESGHAPAQYQLGEMLVKGNGAAKDFEQAVTWYRKAAELGYAPAQYKYGVYLESKTLPQGFVPVPPTATWGKKPGLVTPNSPSNSDNPKSLRTAARVKYKKVIMDSILLPGKGETREEYDVRFARESAVWKASTGDPLFSYYVGRNKFDVKKWRDRQVQSGQEPDGIEVPGKKTGEFDIYAEPLLENQEKAQVDKPAPEGPSSENAPIPPRDPKQAPYWYYEAAEQGVVEAQYELGECYQYGRGVKQDRNQAKYWYRKAADQGNAAAKKVLERFLN